MFVCTRWSIKGLKLQSNERVNDKCTKVQKQTQLKRTVLWNSIMKTANTNNNNKLRNFVNHYSVSLLYSYVIYATKVQYKQCTHNSQLKLTTEPNHHSRRDVRQVFGKFDKFLVVNNFRVLQRYCLHERLVRRTFMETLLDRPFLNAICYSFWTCS